MRATVLAAVLLVVAATVTGCPKTGPVKLCDITYRGLGVRQGLVVNTVNAFCDQPPLTHTMKVQLEFSVGGHWLEQGRAAITTRIPGPPPGFPTDVTATCREGVWRTHVHVEGDGPDGKPFLFDDHGAERTFTFVQCAA